MNADPKISTEGNDPAEAVKRLGNLIDKMIKACPDATILVAMIINTCSATQIDRTKEYQKLIPGVVKTRYDAGHQVLAVDFTTFETSWLQDCIHPTNEGYKTMGDYWYDFIYQTPREWIKKPVEPDPKGSSESGANGGIDMYGLTRRLMRSGAGLITCLIIGHEPGIKIALLAAVSVLLSLYSLRI